MKNWRELDIAEIEKALGVDSTRGLSMGDVESRLEKYGPNQLKKGVGRAKTAAYM